MGLLSARQHQTLIAVAEAVLPAGRFLPAGGAVTADKVEHFARTLPGPLQTALGGLLTGLDALAWVRERRAFARPAPDRRLAILARWRTADPLRRLMLRAVVSPLKMVHFDDPALYRRLGCVYEAQKVVGEAKPAYMRDRVHAALDGDLA